AQCSMSFVMIRVRDVVMRLPSGGRSLTMLDGIPLDGAAGEVLAITGPSGSGKSTLLGLVAGLDRPSAGSIVVAGIDITRLDEDALARFRRETLGYVFQSYHLIPTLTAIENVAVPLEITGTPNALARARALLDDVGLGDRGHHYPVQLSGGEQQRAALARAVALDPGLLLADEPTGHPLLRPGHPHPRPPARAQPPARPHAGAGNPRRRAGPPRRPRRHSARRPRQERRLVTFGFAARMAWRETRGAWRHFAV